MLLLLLLGWQRLSGVTAHLLLLLLLLHHETLLLLGLVVLLLLLLLLGGLLLAKLLLLLLRVRHRLLTTAAAAEASTRSSVATWAAPAHHLLGLRLLLLLWWLALSELLLLLLLLQQALLVPQDQALPELQDLRGQEGLADRLLRHAQTLVRLPQGAAVAVVHGLLVWQPHVRRLLGLARRCSRRPSSTGSSRRRGSRSAGGVGVAAAADPGCVLRRLAVRSRRTWRTRSRTAGLLLLLLAGGDHAPSGTRGAVPEHMADALSPGVHDLHVAFQGPEHQETAELRRSAHPDPELLRAA